MLDAAPATGVDVDAKIDEPPTAPGVDGVPVLDDAPPVDDVDGSRLNLASTLSGALPTTRHEPLPEQSPLQPANFEPLVADATSVTTVPAEYVTLQPPPQLMPAGMLVTNPTPSPDFVTLTL